MDGQTLPGILIHHCQETNEFAVTGTKGHKVVCPDVVPSLCPQPHAGAVSKPESTTLGLFGWYFLSPPRRQIRSTRLWFTLHPSHCSMAVTRRCPYRLASRTTAIVRAPSSSATVAQCASVLTGVAQAPGKRAAQRCHTVPVPTPRISAGEPGSEVSPCCLL